MSEPITSDNPIEPVCDTFQQTLDMMAFIPTDPLEPAQSVAPDEPLIVELSFEGPRRGTLQFVAGRGFARLLAANIIGEDPDDPDAGQKAEDSLKELINVVGGAMMPQLALSEHDVFSLSLPKLSPFDPQRWAAFVDDGARVFDAEGQTVAIRLAA